MQRINQAQRVVLVTGLGLALAFLGNWVQLLFNNSGWIAYAPLSNNINVEPGYDPRWNILWHALVWVGVIAIWVAASWLILRTPKATTAIRPEEQVPPE